MPANKLDPINQTASDLTPNEILISEFNYIAQAAFQANEDRARVTTFYLISLGSLVAALLSSQLTNSNQPEIDKLFICIFIVLSMFGLLTMLQLVRLRQAWFECARALNQIKAFYIKNIKAVKLDDAFRWQKLPAKFKPRSVGFLLALQVAIVSGASCGVAALYIGHLYTQHWEGTIALAVGIVYTTIEILLYWRLLREG